MAVEPERTLLDRSEFQDRDQALALAGRGCPKGYTEVARRHMDGQQPLTEGFLLFGSFVSRMRGLMRASFASCRMTTRTPYSPSPEHGSKQSRLGSTPYGTRATWNSFFTDQVIIDRPVRVSSQCFTPFAKTRAN